MENLLTTRQIQDLIRVDRITVYRMLKDGRLRGFKVGGQWRFPRREIEAWLQEKQARSDLMPFPSPATDNSAQWSQTLSLSCIGAIQSLCAEAMDVAIVTTDLDGRPLSGISNSCAFCNLILSTEAGRQRCAGSWTQQPDGEIHACHAGLFCASSTVATSGQPVALAAACQFTTPAPGRSEAGWQPDPSGLAANLGLLTTEVQAAVASVRVAPESHLLRVSKVVRRVAQVLSDIGQERLNLLGRLEKIAEMSRI